MNIIDLFSLSFFWYPFIGIIVVGISLALMGNFIVWQDMAYFGDSLAHCSLLAVSLAFCLTVSLPVSLFIVACLFSILLFFLHRSNSFSFDLLLGILSHSFFALALLLNFFTKGLNLESFLLGDILLVGQEELLTLFVILVVIIVFILYYWSSLLLLVIHPTLARLEGVPVNKIKFLFILLNSLIVFFSIKIVGVLLISSILILPSATAKIISSSPQQMVKISVIISIISAIVGFFISLFLSIPPAPVVVLVLSIIFFTILIIKKMRGS